MKELRVFNTKINKEHRFGYNKFIEGKIAGIAEALGITRNEEGIPYGIRCTDDYKIIRTRCTEEEYAKFREIVERNYGDGKFEGLVEFDV